MNTSLENPKKNYGISLLRIFFIFMIICFHYDGIIGASRQYYTLREVAAPIFMMIAFILGEKVIASNDFSIQKKRITRLLIPYLFWGVTTFLLLFVLNLFTRAFPVSFADLATQILLGNSEPIDPPLWFQWELMVLIICFIFLYRVASILKGIADHVFITLAVLISVFFYYLQYSGINATLFAGLGYGVQGSLGRFVEMWVFATAGVIIAKFDVVGKLRQHFLASLVILVILLADIMKDPSVLKYPATTFCYAGIPNLVIALLFVLLFMVFPFEKMPEWILKIIDLFSSYTLGIFCVHWTVGKMLNLVWPLLFNTKSTFKECIVIYFVSFALCYLVGKANNKLVK